MLPMNFVLYSIIPSINNLMQKFMIYFFKYFDFNRYIHSKLYFLKYFFKYLHVKMEGHMCQNLFTRKSLGLLYIIKLCYFLQKNGKSSLSTKLNHILLNQMEHFSKIVVCPSYLVFPFENEISKLIFQDFQILFYTYILILIVVILKQQVYILYICRKLHFLNFLILMFISSSK